MASKSWNCGFVVPASAGLAWIAAKPANRLKAGLRAVRGSGFRGRI